MSRIINRGLWWQQRRLVILAGAVVPWVAFLVAVAATSGDADSGLGLVVAAPFYWVVVGLPALTVALAARHPLVAGAGIVVMTAVAIFAGITMAASDDAQAGLAALIVAYVGVPLALFTWIGESVTRRAAVERHHAGGRVLVAAALSARMCAFAIDLLVVGAVLYLPLTVLSHANHEVAAVLVGLAVGTASFALPVVWWGHSFGQGLLGLRTVDAVTGELVPLVRAVGRSFTLCLEALGAVTIVLAIPAAADCVALATTGRSLLDRLFRTAVLARS